MATTSSSPTNPERQAHILEAAFHCFLQRGYAGTTMAHIAARAHLSRSLLYLQFKSKEDIFGALVEQLLDEGFERAVRARGSRKGRREQLLGVIEAWELELWGRITASPHGDELLGESYRLRPRLEAMHRRRTNELLEELLEDAEVREVFLLSLKGLQADRPRVELLRRRVELLVDLVLKR